VQLRASISTVVLSGCETYKAVYHHQRHRALGHCRLQYCAQYTHAASQSYQGYQDTTMQAQRTCVSLSHPLAGRRRVGHVRQRSEHPCAAEPSSHNHSCYHRLYTSKNRLRTSCRNRSLKDTASESLIGSKQDIVTAHAKALGAGQISRYPASRGRQLPEHAAPADLGLIFLGLAEARRNSSELNACLLIKHASVSVTTGELRFCRKVTMAPDLQQHQGSRRAAL